MTRPAPRENQMLNLFKCMAIYCVVLIHIPLPGTLGRAVCALGKFSVALFFLTSGLFSWDKSCAQLARRARRTGGLLLKTSLALLALGCILTLRQGGTIPHYLLSRLDPFFLKEILLYQLLPFPYAWPTWHLASLFVVYLIWWVLTFLAQRLGKRLPYNALACLGVGLLVLHLARVEWAILAGGQPVQSMQVRNAWLEGLPFFALGAWLGEHRDKLARCRPTLVWMLALLSGLLALAEFLLIEVVDVYVGTSLLALLLVAASLVRPEVKSALLRRTACFCGSRLTFYIYVLHVPLYGIVKEWQGQVPAFAWLMGQSWLLPMVIGGTATLLALALDQWATWRQTHGRRKSRENH